MKKFFIYICNAIIIISILTGCTQNRNNLYDPTNTDITLPRIFFMESVEENQTLNVVDSQKDLIDETAKHATNIRPVDKSSISDIENQMVEFFKSNYNVDISNKLSSVETYYFDSKSEDVYIMGYHVPGEKKVYVNSDLAIEISDYFAFTWCHEVIHLLGLNYTYNTYWGLYEAVTEAVNIELMDWMDMPYTDISAYMDVYHIGAQLISANPDLVSKSLSDDDFLIEDDINTVLADATYPCAKVPENNKIAFQFSSYLTCLIENNDIYTNLGPVIDYSIQEITTAYCRSFSLNSEQIEFAKSHWLLEDYATATIKAEENGFVFVR